MENKSLVAIVNEAFSLEQMLIESGGEITPEIENALSVNSNEMTTKLDGYHHIIERFESLESHYKDRALFFNQVGTQCKNAVSRLKENIKFAMMEMGIDEVRGSDVRFKLSKTSGTLEITDKELVPVEFKSEVITTEIDKKALKEALQKGEPIQGAELKEGYSLRAYANTPDKKKKVEA